MKGIGGNAFLNRFLILFCKEEKREKDIDRKTIIDSFLKKSFSRDETKGREVKIESFQISNCKLQIFQIQSEISNLKFEMVSKDWGLL